MLLFLNARSCLFSLEPCICSLFTPVSTSITLISSPSSSSTAAPQMIFACGEILFGLFEHIFLLRESVLTTDHVNQCSSVSDVSNSSTENVRLSRFLGLLFDEAPSPIIATPPLDLITAFKSSKSRLTMPSVVSNSVTPVIDLTNNSSPTLNALAIGRSFTPSISSNLHLESLESCHSVL